MRKLATIKIAYL